MVHVHGWEQSRAIALGKTGKVPEPEPVSDPSPEPAPDPEPDPPDTSGLSEIEKRRLGLE